MQNFDRLIAAVKHTSTGDAKMKALGALLAELRAVGGDRSLLRLSIGNLVVVETEDGNSEES